MGKEDERINVIWFCVDGTARKLFPKAIQSLSRATAMWKSVPVVVVITKSYSVPERKENIEMVQSAFAVQTKFSSNLKKIIPVVASVYQLNETAYAAPEGITELIDITNELMPEGIKAGAEDIARFKLNRKRGLAQGIVGGTVPIAGSLLNAIIAGVIVASLGEGTIYAFEQVYLGNKTVEDIDWVTQVLESKFMVELVERVKAAIQECGDHSDAKKIVEVLFRLKK